MPTYQFKAVTCFLGSLSGVHWAETQLMHIVEKASKEHGLQVDIETHGGRRPKESEVSGERSRELEVGDEET